MSRAVDPDAEPYEAAERHRAKLECVELAALERILVVVRHDELTRAGRGLAAVHGHELYIVMALYSYGLHSYGPIYLAAVHGHELYIVMALYSYGLHSYDPIYLAAVHGHEHARVRPCALQAAGRHLQLVRHLAVL